MMEEERENRGKRKLTLSCTSAMEIKRERIEQDPGERERGGRGDVRDQETKFISTDEGDAKQIEKNSFNHKLPSSLVIHVRGLSNTTVEADLVEALSMFGNICDVIMMPFKNQALVEFDSLESAEHCVTHGTSSAVHVAGQQVFFNFSTSRRISRTKDCQDPVCRNKVLLFSVQNPLYPITTDILFMACNPISPVLRIVIFKRHGIMAMVEFMSVSDASKVKLALNGAEIYTGCCRLSIQYAKPKTLNILCNDHNSWDYTRQRGSRCCPLLPLPYNSRYSSIQEPQTSSSVIMVAGLHPLKMNCSRIFNLLCVYGNVGKVKFLKSVPCTVLVEMGDRYAVDRAVTHLNNITVFGKKLNVCWSKQQTVIPTQVFPLADGSRSYQDFSLSRNNRFSDPRANYNVIQPPSAILHFYNAPPSFSQQQLHQLCEENSVSSFIRLKVFKSKASSVSPQTQSGLLEFDTRNAAAETLIVLNNYRITVKNSSAQFTLKLCFSTSNHL